MRWPSLLLVLVLALPAAAEARTFNGHVSKVVDGDTVRVKVGSKKRAFNLAGVAAPAAGACFAVEAKAALVRMLKRNAAVKVRSTRSGARIFRAGKSINRAVVKGGFARAKSGGGAFGARLRSDEAAAKAAGRGLHSACAPPGTGTPPGPDPAPVPGDVTGQAAIDQMEAELTGMFFRNFSSGSSSSTTYTIHWCPNGDWRSFTESLYSSGGTSFSSRREYLGNPWNVTEALIKEDGTRYAVIGATIRSTASNDGPEPVGDPNTATRFDFVDGQWYWAGEAAQAFPGEADCGPVLDHG